MCLERAELARLTGDEATRPREVREAHRLFIDEQAPPARAHRPPPGGSAQIASHSIDRSDDIARPPCDRLTIVVACSPRPPLRSSDDEEAPDPPVGSRQHLRS